MEYVASSVLEVASALGTIADYNGLIIIITKYISMEETRKVTRTERATTVGPLDRYAIEAKLFNSIADLIDLPMTPINPYLLQQKSHCLK